MIASSARTLFTEIVASSCATIQTSALLFEDHEAQHRGRSAEVIVSLDKAAARSLGITPVPSPRPQGLKASSILPGAQQQGDGVPRPDRFHVVIEMGRSPARRSSSYVTHLVHVHCACIYFSPE